MTKEITNPVAHAIVTRVAGVVGSGNALARALGVTPTTISLWKHRGIPADQAIRLEKMTGIPVRELRPDLWAENDNAPTPPEAA